MNGRKQRIRLRGFVFVVAGLLASCESPLRGFNSAEKKEIAPGVWLHRTSGQTVTLTDAEGSGLVYGSIVRIGYKAHEKRKLVVAYRPFVEGAKADERNDGHVVEIDLITHNVVPLEDPGASIVRSLQPIDKFF